MRSRTGLLQILATTLAVLLAVAGCSNLPTKPDGSLQAESGAGLAGAAAADGLDLRAGGSAVPATKSQVVGVLGGVVSAGDFKVVIPPGAVPRNATVTVTQPDPDRPVVELSISPASANRFALPVLLVADAKRMDHSLLPAAFVSYYNPATGQWERVSGSLVSLPSLTVSAPLHHFSKYRVSRGGKAGW